MSWSPNPYDDRMFEEYQANRQFSNLSDDARNRTLRSQLPSSIALHNGATLTRRKYAARSRGDIEAGRDSEALDGPTVPTVSGAVEGDMLVDDLTWKDVECLKELTCSMAKKKEIRNNLLKERGTAVRSGWQGNSGLKWKRFKEDSKEVFRRMQLWSSSIHEIEGRFGNGVRSYFAFLRWLFLLNIYIFLLVFFFVCVPTIIFENLNATSTEVTTVNGSTECAYSPYDPNAVSSFSQYVIWWFTGQGFMENTLLFYGYYENTVSALNAGSYGYNLPLAYIFVTFSYFLLSLILLVRKAAVGVKESMLSGEIRFYAYCNKIFAGWDFCITDERAADLKHSSLKYELETDLEEERIKRRQAERTTKEKIGLYTKRFLINLFIFCVLVGSLAAIYFAAEYALRNTRTFDDNFFLDLLVTYLVSIVITIANFIAPLIFEFLVVYEDYSPAFTIKFTLIRTVFLRLVSVMFLYVVVYLQINCDDYDLIEIPKTNCGYCEGMPCWETYMGQEMYKLTILDFFIVIAVTLFVEFPRRLIVEHCDCGLSRWVGRQEFDIRACVLDLIYSQTVLWIGAFYAPMLPVIVVIKFFVFFYLKKLTLLYNCQPASKPFRTSRSGTFFFMILMFGFVVAALPVGVSLSIIPPSQYCGPFRGLDTMFQAVVNAIHTLPEWLSSIFWFIGSGGFAVIVGVILCLVMYYYVALNSAHKKMISLLKDQLTLEGKDKQYLLNRVNDLQMRMMGIQQGDRKVRTAEVANRAQQSRVNMAYEEDDEGGSLPGQAADGE